MKSAKNRYKRQKISSYFYLVFAIFALASVFFTFNVKAYNHRLIAGCPQLLPYTADVSFLLPSYSLSESDESIYVETKNKNAVTCFDWQVFNALDAGLIKYFYPHGETAVVLAVDTTKVSQTVNGFSDLLLISDPVGTISDNAENRMAILGAMSYALEGENYTNKTSLNLLRHLAEANRLKLNDSGCPILICLDLDAYALSSDYKIIIPREGTLKYTFGTASNLPLDFESDVNSIFPKKYSATADNADYYRAYKVSNFDRFIQTTEDINRDFRRKVFSTRLFSSADHREHTFVALILAIIVIIWLGSVSFRIARKDIRNIALLIGWSIIGWLILRLLKYQLPSGSTADTYCWYIYYAFQTLLPLLLLLLSAIVDKNSGERVPKKIFLTFLVIYLASVTFVCTNNLHQLMFKIKGGDTYSYGPGFFVVSSLTLCIFISAIIILFIKSQKTKISGRIFLTIIIGLMLLYGFGYISNINLIRDSDYTVTICFLILMLFEAILHTGFIPNNTKYKLLFYLAPIDMVIINKDGEPILMSKLACGTSSQYPNIKSGNLSYSSKNPDTLIHKKPITGGTIIWQEDISTVNSIKAEITSRNKQLKASNTLLAKKHEIQSGFAKIKAREKLFINLEKTIEKRMNVIKEKIDLLDKVEENIKNKEIAYIALALCHIKRRCNLFFMYTQGLKISGEELSIYLDELSELTLTYLKINSVIRTSVTCDLPPDIASIFFDFYFETISLIVNDKSSVVIATFKNSSNVLSFCILLDISHKNLNFSDELLHDISASGGNLFINDLDDAQEIHLSISLEDKDG